MKFEKPKSSIERVVGASPELEEKILKDQAEIFDNQLFEELRGKEREKTEEEIQIIALANEATNALRRKYGMDNFDIPPKNFHIIPGGKWPKDKNLLGVYNARFQGIALKDAHTSKLFTLANIIHESLHFKAYNALQISLSDKSEKREEPALAYYRGGLEAWSRDGKTKYFTELNEAITEELNKNILKELGASLWNNPLFADEMRQTLEIIESNPGALSSKTGKQLFTSDTIHAETKIPTDIRDLIKYILGKRSLDINTKSHTYKRQRRMLHSLIDKVWKAHKDEFGSRDEVFGVFERAYITGNILPMGRLIENTFGKGSLRKIAKLDMGTNRKNP